MMALCKIILTSGRIVEESIDIDPKTFQREMIVAVMHKHGQTITTDVERVRVLLERVVAFDHERASRLVAFMYVDESGALPRRGPLPINPEATKFYDNIARYNGYAENDPIHGVAVLMPKGWSEQ